MTTLIHGKAWEGPSGKTGLTPMTPVNVEGTETLVFSGSLVVRTKQGEESCQTLRLENGRNTAALDELVTDGQITRPVSFRFAGGSYTVEEDAVVILGAELSVSAADEGQTGVVFDLTELSETGIAVITLTPTPTEEPTAADPSPEPTPASTPFHADTPVSAPTETEAETVRVETDEDGFTLTNAMTVQGSNGEIQVSEIRIRGAQASDAWLEEIQDQEITDTQQITLSGGACTLSGAVLEFEGGELTLTPASEEQTAKPGVFVSYDGAISGAAAQSGSHPAGWIAAALELLLLALAAVWLLKLRKQRRQEAAEKAAKAEQDQLEENRPPEIRLGTLSNIGARPAQQDSCGSCEVRGGVFAVLADGMGGLKNGDVVSQKIVQTMTSDCKDYSAEQLRGNLLPMIAHVNDEVNRMLGRSDLYKSGSTLVAVLAEPQQFSWATVGDSRVYLYRAGRLIQLNREHTYEAELMIHAVNHEVNFQEARNHPKRKSVASFIGMGMLKHVDTMARPIRTQKGDRVILSSDGVFNTLPDSMIEAVLAENPDPVQAAQRLEAAVLERRNPHQDNFTAVIISYE